MDNNRGQTIFLSVIGVATLLVAIIGATFAYFTTQVTGSGTGGSLEGTTAKVSGTTLTFDTNTQQTHAYLQYPGGLAVFGTVATFEKDDPNDKNDYTATYNLEIKYINPTHTDLDYTLYMLEDAPTEENLNANCTLQSKVSGKETHLWYGNTDSEDSTCQFPTKIEMFIPANTIASGVLKAGNGVSTEQKIDSETELGEEIVFSDTMNENPLKGRKLDTKNTNKKYYYLVVNYPNEGDQSQDATGGEISVSLTISEGSITVDQGAIE